MSFSPASKRSARRGSASEFNRYKLRAPSPGKWHEHPAELYDQECGRVTSAENPFDAKLPMCPV